MGVIYKITAPSGRAYVGMTRVPVEQRWRQHKSAATKSKGCSALSAAIQKYGWEKMQKEVLEEAENSKLQERETAWILALDTYKNGYNLTKGGDHNPMLNRDVVARMRNTVLNNPELAKQRSIECVARNKEEWSRPSERKRRGGVIRQALNTPEMLATKHERHARMMKTKAEQREKMLSKLPPEKREKHRAFLDRKKRERKARKGRAAHESSGTTLCASKQVSGCSMNIGNGHAYTSETCHKRCPCDVACSRATLDTTQSAPAPGRSTPLPAYSDLIPSEDED